LAWQEASEELASSRAFVMITFIILILCVGRDLAPEAPALFAGIETNAAILAFGIFVFIIARVSAVARTASSRAAVSQ